MQSSVTNEHSTVTNPVVPVPHRVSFIGFGIILLIAFGLLGLLAFAWVQRQAPPLEAGLAPQFELKTFDGATVRLADLRGKAVVINFWASWCVPCRDEAPVLQAMWQKYRAQGVVILGVDYVDTENEARKFIQEFGQTYPNGPDVGTQISQKYRITGVPETYFITPEGTVLGGTDVNGRPYGNWIGPLTASALEGRILKLLEK